ncbi:MAG: class II aldolase/adducin family protein [Terracidiphilus sp.]
MECSALECSTQECAAQGAPPAALSGDPVQIFNSPAVQAIKKEIVRVGKKLWKRHYVDGNGGNISARVSDEFVICSPTLVSKGDLRVEDLALVDLENRRICGFRPHTSELLLHLEIYKTVPEAKAVIHCHPPYATAHAVAGVIPQSNLVPEQEVFIGLVALTPYETPGSLAFARTVRGVAKDHNTILLANHGIACWADTLTHAEWYAEIIETYCKTVMIAKQLRPDLPEISPDKMAELLALKQKLGMSLPDPRTKVQAQDAGKPEASELEAADKLISPSIATPLDAFETDKLVSRLTAEVAAFLQTRR